MTNVGDIVVSLSDGDIRLPRLSVRQFVSMQNTLASRRARTILEDAKSLGMTHAAAIEKAHEARESASLTSSLIRWCFSLEGALEIVRESCADGTKLERIECELSPDQITEIALQLVGFEWDTKQGKWVSRSRGPSGRGTG